MSREIHEGLKSRLVCGKCHSLALAGGANPGRVGDAVGSKSAARRVVKQLIELLASLAMAMERVVHCRSQRLLDFAPLPAILRSAHIGSVPVPS